MSFRANRLSEEIKREVTDLLQNHLKDPRIGKLTSVIAVDVSRDLRYAKIYVSVYGGKEEQQKTLTGLHQASGFIRSELGKRIRLRHVPEISFAIDTSITYSLEINRLLEQVNQRDGIDSDE